MYYAHLAKEFITLLHGCLNKYDEKNFSVKAEASIKNPISLFQNLNNLALVVHLRFKFELDIS